MKTITLTRRELLWQTRHITWTEKDWIRFLEWLKQAVNEKNYWHDNYAGLYEKVKDMSWDEVVADFNDPKISVPVVRKYSDGTSWTYDQTLYDAVKEAMREDCYDADIDGEDYADDYDEDIEIDDIDKGEE